jgi:hypothetical protein
LALSKAFAPIHPESIANLYQFTIANSIPSPDILHPHILPQLPFQQ